MAATAAGDVTPDVQGVPDMHATINNMMDSITTLQNQMAELLEDQDRFFIRSPDASSGEKGPAVRGHEYSHAQQSDRMQMHEMHEVINMNTSKLAEMNEAVKSTNQAIDELESNSGLFSSELTTDRDNLDRLQRCQRPSG